MSGAGRTIVITGIGAVTPLGTGNDVFWGNLAAGKSGVRHLQAFDTHGEGTTIGAEVRDFEPARYVKQRKSLKVMARDIQLAVGSAFLAVQDAALDTSAIDPVRFGVSCGAALIASELDELGPPVSSSMNGNKHFDLKKWGEEGMQQLFPLWMLKYLPNMPACHISIFYDAQGPNNSITVGESSATLAIGEAFRVLTRNDADIFLCGGADSRIHPLSIVRLALLRRLSRRKEDPATACRPFDAQRDGEVIGEGAGMLVLEELEHARRRNAKIYGRVLGFATTCNPRNPREAIARALSMALADAGISPAEVGHVAAAGNSSVEVDRIEMQSLADVFGDHPVPIVGYKGYLGHLSAASGAVELIASLLAARAGELPRTLNFHTADPDAPPVRILKENIPFPQKPFMSYALSHSGQCGALVVDPRLEG